MPSTTIFHGGALTEVVAISSNVPLASFAATVMICVRPSASIGKDIAISVPVQSAGAVELVELASKNNEYETALFAVPVACHVISASSVLLLKVALGLRINKSDEVVVVVVVVDAALEVLAMVVLAAAGGTFASVLFEFPLDAVTLTPPVAIGAGEEVAAGGPDAGGGSA